MFARSTIVYARATYGSVMTRLTTLACLTLVFFAGPAYAHDELEAPRPISIVDGQWPPGPVATHDVVVPLLVIVTATGEVNEATVDVSLAPDIDAAAIDAARMWRFAPATRSGVALPSRARIAVRFRAPHREADAGVPDAAMVDAAVPDAATDEPAHYGAQAIIEGATRSASETVRERATLNAAPHRTAADMLLAVPGVFVTQHGGEGKAYQIFYRGFDAVHGQDLEVWVGGAPVNDVSNIHGQGYADLNFIMPEVVRSIRTTPGTYDPRQGDFAVAGTVRYELGYDQPGLTAKAGFGSFGSARYFLAYRPKGSNEGTFAAAEFYDTDGFGPSRAAQRASAVAQSLWKLGDSTSARLMFSAYTGHFDSAGVLRLRDIQSGAVDRFASYDPNQGGASSRFQLVGELGRETDDSKFSVAPYLVVRSLRLRQNFTGYLGDASGDSQQQLNDALSFGGTAFYRIRQRIFSARDRLELGIFARSDWIDQSQRRLATADQRVTANQVDARVRAIDVAGYFDLALHPLSRVTLRGGLRVDGLSYLTVDNGAQAAGQARASQGAHFGKKATLEVDVLPGLDLVGSYGEGFRSPQARGLAESEATPFTRVTSAEGGLRYANEQVAVTAAGFRTWLSDDLVFDQATTRNEVVPATRRTGATADASWRPVSWVNLNLNGTYTRAEFRETARGYRKGDLVPYAPQIVTRADLAVTPTLFAWKGRKLQTQVGTGISYLARRPLPYAQLGHHIFLLDAQASVRFGEGGLSLRAYNLLNANWYDGEFSFASNWDPGSGASLVPARHVTVGAPRTLLATLELYL
jgi:iron complex outermembrane recepter protein